MKRLTWEELEKRQPSITWNGVGAVARYCFHAQDGYIDDLEAKLKLAEEALENAKKVIRYSLTENELMNEIGKDVQSSTCEAVQNDCVFSINKTLAKIRGEGE